jgi:type II restriction/modification system DNA methylase subunit YeeA
VEPVVIQPLVREWDDVRAKVAALSAPHQLTRHLSGSQLGARTKAISQAASLVTAFLARLDRFRILDPACGSGNFLYVALQALKDLERRVLVWETTELRTPMRFPTVGPHNVRGIELNSYAAELARVTIWIGEIQWMITNGFAYLKDPVLRPLHAIECRDAVLLEDEHGSTEPTWPDADVIIGNPPFLGSKRMRTALGDEYVDRLFTAWDGRVPREADLVTYWHEKARSMIAAGKVRRVGLLATQGIRGGVNRRVLERIKETADIFLA